MEPYSNISLARQRLEAGLLLSSGCIVLDFIVSLSANLLPAFSTRRLIPTRLTALHGFCIFLSHRMTFEHSSVLQPRNAHLLPPRLTKVASRLDP